MAENDEKAAEAAPKKDGRPVITRRALCVGLGGTAALVGLGAVRYAGSAPLVRPPGGQDEDALVPALLLAEVVFFRKWCSTFCPISALMSLIGKANRTFVPQVNDAKCRETVEGASCEVCAAVCPQGINVRHPEAGMSFSECTKCRACVEACPTQAIKMPFLPQKVQGASTVVVEDEDAVTAS